MIFIVYCVVCCYSICFACYSCVYFVSTVLFACCFGVFCFSFCIFARFGRLLGAMVLS